MCQAALNGKVKCSPCALENQDGFKYTLLWHKDFHFMDLSACTKTNRNFFRWSLFFVQRRLKHSFLCREGLSPSLSCFSAWKG